APELSALLNWWREEPPASQTETQRRAKATEAVTHASTKVNRGSFRQIFRRARDLADFRTQPNDLGEHLVVEHKIVGVLFNRDTLEQTSGKGAISGVIFRQLRADHKILDEGEEAVRDIFPPRHSAIERAAAQNARSEHARIQSARNQRRHRRKQL